VWRTTLIGEFGGKQVAQASGAVLVEVVESGDQPELPWFAGEVRDDLLRMLFVCCDDAIPRESQLVMALRRCAASAPGDRTAAFHTEANVYKRLARAATASAK